MTKLISHSLDNDILYDAEVLFRELLSFARNDQLSLIK